MEQLQSVASKVARLLADAEDDLLAWVNREIARRSDVVGISPDEAALLRLAAGRLVEMNDEWLLAHRSLSLHSMALLEPDGHGPSGPSAPTRQLCWERWPAPESPLRNGT